MKLISFSIFCICACHCEVKVIVSGLDGEIAKFEIDNAMLKDPTGARISVERFKELIFEGIHQHKKPDFQFDPNLANLVEGAALLARVPADDEEVRINLMKGQPKYKVSSSYDYRNQRMVSFVKLNGLNFCLIDPEHQTNGPREAEISELSNFIIKDVSYPYNSISNYAVSIYNPMVKMNERTVQVLNAIRHYVGPDIKSRNWIFKAFEIAGIEYEGHEDSQVSEEDEETIKELLGVQGLLAHPIA